MLIGVALLIGGCGDGADSGVSSRSSRSASPVDRAFVSDMIPHHEAAVQMAQAAQRRGSTAFVTRLAADILRSQRAEVALMRAADRRLAAAGVAVGSLDVAKIRMGMDHDPAVLRTAKPFDAMFLRMMIPHHQGAIVMARAERAKGTDAQMRAFATRIISTQRREIAQMRAHVGTASTGAMGAGHAMSGDGAGG
jgi:uncharacterized protein (DUF305 family)